MIQSILQVIFCLLFVYLSINAVYFFIIALAGKIKKTPAYTINSSKKKIAVLIATYKEDNIIVHTAQNAIKHDYPSDCFDVFIAADKLKPETIAKLRAIPVNVTEVEFEVSSKARSLNALLNAVPENNYDIAIILDADNIMQPGCLEKVNDVFQKGYRAVQTHRIAKNTNTPVALLDAISEEINNNIFRRGQRALGLSANVIGSGMAFEFKKLKEIYNKPGILGNPACDREVDFELMKSKICIEFIDDAYVLDEKVSNVAVFERQRTRWLESQMTHLKMFFSKESGYLPKTKDFWNKLFHNVFPPRVIFLLSFAIAFFLFILELITGLSILSPGYLWWLILTIIYVSGLLISIPNRFYSKPTLNAIAYLPVLILSMVKAMFKMNVNRKEFLHTPKTFTSNRP